MRKLRIGDIIKVTWVDQNSYTEVTEAAGAISTCQGNDVGFFLEENKDWLALSMERMQCEGNTPKYRHVVSLPKVCIKKIQVLESYKR